MSDTKGKSDVYENEIILTLYRLWNLVAFH